MLLFLSFALLDILWLCSEENTSIQDVGVDMLLKDGKLEELKKGPVYWVDASDSQPCMATATAIVWTLRAEGHLFHSGLPHKVIRKLSTHACLLACQCSQ